MPGSCDHSDRLKSICARMRPLRRSGRGVAGVFPVNDRETGTGSPAFTLIEIMIVVSILAIVMVTGVPFVQQALNKEPLRQAVSDLVEACKQARAQAILKGTPAEVRIRAEDGRISVHRIAERRGEADPGPESEGGGAVFEAFLSDEIAVEQLDVNFEDQMENELARVRFQPNGICDEFTITFSDLEGEMKIITMDVVTSQPEILDPEDLK